MSLADPAKIEKGESSNFEHPKGSGIVIDLIVNQNNGVTYGESYEIRVPKKLTNNKREKYQRKTRHDAIKCAEEPQQSAVFGNQRCFVYNQNSPTTIALLSASAI